MGVALSKGSRQRPQDKAKFDKEFDRIFRKPDYREEVAEQMQRQVQQKQGNEHAGR